ncbi:MAG: hypothetical protein AAF488_08910, partial [Planctomycetota bacterium]
PHAKYFGMLSEPSTAYWMKRLARLESQAAYGLVRYYIELTRGRGPTALKRLQRCRFCFAPQIPVRGRSSDFCPGRCRTSFHSQPRSSKSSEERLENLVRYRTLMESLPEHLRDPGWEDME